MATKQELKYVKHLRKLFTISSPDKHKGQCGRAAFLGGSFEYTGAPYFAAMTALRTGSDLSYVVCAESAGPVIKGYSPDLIVHPFLDKANVMSLLAPTIPKFHVASIGSGLGRSYNNERMDEIVCGIAETNPDCVLIMDADALFYLGSMKRLHSLLPLDRLILTPNLRELDVLYTSLVGAKADSLTTTDRSVAVAQKLGAIVVCKGARDVITDGRETVQCTRVGSSRRCGGQGDILVGAVASFVHAARSAEGNIDGLSPLMLGAYAACCVTREANRLAFAEKASSMITSDMLERIPRALASIQNEQFD